jgi:hypothetical protein
MRLVAIPALVLAFATIMFLSLDINAHRARVYIADVSLKPASGILKVAFYANRYRTYLGDASIKFSEKDWDVAEYSDAAVLTARSDRSALTIMSYGAPLYFSLLGLPNGGTAFLTDGLDRQQEVDLRSDFESIKTFTIGGTNSAVASIAGTEFIAPFHYYSVYALLIAIFSLLAYIQVRGHHSFQPRSAVQTIPATEIAGYTAPLVIVPLIVQLAFWPASVPHDGGMQWMEAAERGQLTSAIIIPATLLFRQFTNISINPAYAVFAQIVFGALSISLVLREIRRRGVSRRLTQSATIVIAILPQYPTFITTLSKDAWNCIGLLVVAYATLSLLRHFNEMESNKTLKSLGLLIALMVSALFAGTMRPNTVPALVIFMLLLALYFGRWIGIKIPATLFASYLLFTVLAPKVVEFYSEESQAERAVASANQVTTSAPELPLGPFANFYIIHLFAAAVHSDVPIPKQDEQLFYNIAPKTAWQEYDCSYVDKTQIALAESGLLAGSDMHSYLMNHQVDMALAVLELILRNPGILLVRQACVTRILWHIGYHSFPFQVNATIGFDSVPDRFLAAVGENRSLIGTLGRQRIAEYVAWTEAWTQLWLFWKPFLFLGIGVFVVLVYSVVNNKSDVLLMAMLPMALTFTLAIFIAFPAYRYQYPATLIFMLLTLLAFARPTADDRVAVGKAIDRKSRESL